MHLSSFWMDVWLGDEALAEVYPALYSHCTCKDVTVREVLDTRIQTIFAPRLTTLTSRGQNPLLIPQKKRKKKDRRHWHWSS